MNRLLRRFWPPFFEKFDRWMLVNYPRLWTTRLHGLLLAIAGLALVAGLKVFFISDAHVPNVEAEFTVLCIVSGLVWVGWMVSMYAFRPGKYPGSRQSGLQYVASVLVGTFLVAVVPVMYGFGVNHQLDMDGNFRYWEEDRILDFGGSYWTYDEYGLDRSGYVKEQDNHVYGLDARRLSRTEKLEYAISLFTKYGGDLNGVSTQDLMAAHQIQIAMPSSFESEVSKVYTNLRHKRDASYLFEEWRELPTFKSEVTHVILFVFMLIGLLGVVFQHASLRQFVWALIAFGVIFITVGLLAFVNDLSNTFNDDKLISSLILTSYILVGLVAFGGIKKFVKMRKAGLILLGLALPFFGLVLGFFGDEVLDISLRNDWGLRESYQSFFWLGVVPTLITFGLWVTVFIPQLQKLQTHPSRK